MSISIHRTHPSLWHASSVVGGMRMEVGFGSCLILLLRDVSLSSPEALAFQEDKSLLELGGMTSIQVPGTLCPHPLEVVTL